MMDMNGDGFPDIIAGGTIQYTNSQGGLSGEIYKGIGANNSDNASEAWGYGGNPVASVSDITKLISGSKSSAQNQQSSWLAQFSISGSAPKNTDEAVESFIDINGDGLPDKILSDKKVRLNLGYAFTELLTGNLTASKAARVFRIILVLELVSTRLPVVSPQVLVLLHLKMRRNTTLSTSTQMVFQTRYGRAAMVS